MVAGIRANLRAKMWVQANGPAMSIPIYQVDAFTDQPFRGNPAAVCLLPQWKTDEWLQSVAAEMNLSETAYVVPRGKGEAAFDLRWFTPKLEVDLCGHATLASAHVLWEAGRVPQAGTIDFHTRSGVLRAARRGERIELDFPLNVETPADPPEGLAESLGISLGYVGKSRFDHLVEVDSESILRRLQPDFRRLAAIAMRGLIVTCRSDDPRYDFVSRFFAPGAGIDEDPVTGSAHCTLAGFWRKRLGKSQFVAYQASPRGGVVHVRIEGDRVCLGGTAVTVLRGELLCAG
jgi:PhzF family phenazine biosynthesis protein